MGAYDALGRVTQLYRLFGNGQGGWLPAYEIDATYDLFNDALPLLIPLEENPGQQSWTGNGLTSGLRLTWLLFGSKGNARGEAPIKTASLRHHIASHFGLSLYFVCIMRPFAVGNWQRVTAGVNLSAPQAAQPPSLCYGFPEVNARPFS